MSANAEQLIPVMSDIDFAIGISFPDGDPIDYLSKYKIETLDAAVRVNTTEKSFYGYVADYWEQHLMDNPELAEQMGGNPWRY
jgi:hypothetical protein